MHAQLLKIYLEKATVIVVEDFPDELFWLIYRNSNHLQSEQSCYAYSTRLSNLTFFTEDIWTCHSKTSAGVINNINNGCIPFSFALCLCRFEIIML